MNSSNHPHLRGMSRLDLIDASTFHQQFWANQEAFEAMISRSPPIIQAHPFIRGRLGLADDTDGQVVCLSEYSETLKHLQNLYNDPFKRGVILTGSPGVGKTYSLVYFVHWCLAHRFPFFFTTSWRLTLYFDAQGIWSIDRDPTVHRFTEFSSLNPDPSSNEGWRPWSFIDSGEHTPPSSAVTDIFNVFPVFAAPPDPSRYKVWRKQFFSRVITLIMNVPTKEELSQLFAVQTISSSVGLEQLGDAIRVAGPCPRDLFTIYPNSTSSHHRLNDYLQNTDMRDIPLLVSQLFLPNSYVEVSHCLFILVRGKWSELTQDDEVSADFKSSHIRDTIWQRQRFIDFKDALVLYKACRVTPQTTSLSAWIFESMAVHITSGSIPFQRQKLAGNFHALTGSSDDLSHCEILLHDDSGARVTTLSTHQGTFFYFPHFRLAESAASTTTVTSLPIAKRELVTFLPEHLTDIKVVPTAYYIPSNPLFAFDAFILDKSADGGFTLWILHMTKAERQQDANFKGSEAIKELRVICEKEVGPVSLKHVVITPGPGYSNEDRIVAWRLPKGWEEDEAVRGEVYIQFIDVDDLPPTLTL